MLEHHRSRPDLPDRIGDPLAEDVRRAAVHRLEARGKLALRIEVRRRRDPDRAGASRSQVRQDVAKRFEPTTTSNQSGCWTKCAVRMSMWYWLVFTPGYSAAIALKRSSQYGMVIAIPFDFVPERTCLRAPAFASSQAQRRIRSTPWRL